MEKPKLELEQQEIQKLLEGLDMLLKQGGINAAAAIYPIGAKLSQFQVDLEKHRLRSMIAEEDEAKAKAEEALAEQEKKNEETQKALEVVKDLTEGKPGKPGPKGVTDGPPNKKAAAN